MTGGAPLLGLSLMPEPDFLRAALPLLARGEVDVLEWSFDLGWGEHPLPEGLDALLDEFAAAGRLLGHGVHLSVLSARGTPRQRAWLARLAAEVRRRRYRHVSEHLGWSTAGRFERGPPLPAPLSRATLAAGRERLGQLAQAAGVPVGLENLALALHPDDVARQGELLDRLLSPVDGFLVLDLHNLHCQAVNFRRDPVALLESYPLARVRELHVSGGSWSRAPGRSTRIRRDTHDGAVPDAVLALLRAALARCPAVHAVILERLGGTLGDAEAARFRADYRRLRRALAPPGSAVPPPPPRGPLLADDAAQLDALQAAWLDALARGDPPPAAAPYAAHLQRLDPAMLAVAGELVRKWGRGGES